MNGKTTHPSEKPRENKSYDYGITVSPNIRIFVIMCF